MYAGDQSRKGTLVDYGFRLPSAKDKNNTDLNSEKPLWIEDEEEFAKLCGLR